MARVVVVGAGVGGLAVAARLSTQGHDVLVLEQHVRAGGKLSTHEREGYRFDTGPSLLTLPAVYRDLFLKTAVSRRNASLEDSVGLVSVDPAYHYEWHDGTSVVLPGSNTNRVAAALGDALGGNAADQWRNFSRIAAEMWSVTRAPYLESPVDGWRSLLPLVRSWSSVRTVRPWSTLRGLGKKCFSDQRLRHLLDRYATYTGADPRHAPAALAVIPYIEQTFGVWHIAGGIGSLADALHERCVQRGVNFRFETTVSEVIVAGMKATGVRTEHGERFDADVVVSDVDSQQLYGDLLKAEDVRSVVRRNAAGTQPMLSGFMSLLAVRGRTPDVQHHNVWFPAQYDREFDDIFAAAPRPVREPTIYACVPDDTAMRPDAEHEAWSLLVNAPAHAPSRGVDWDDTSLVRDYTHHVLGLLAARGCDLSERLVWSEVRTPRDIERQSLAPGGSIYGSAANSRLAPVRRPGNRSPIRGLFLTGGSAHPGGGLPLVGISAAIVADLVGPA